MGEGRGSDCDFGICDSSTKTKKVGGRYYRGSSRSD